MACCARVATATRSGRCSRMICKSPTRCFKAYAREPPARRISRYARSKRRRHRAGEATPDDRRCSTRRACIRKERRRDASTAATASRPSNSGNRADRAPRRSISSEAVTLGAISVGSSSASPERLTRGDTSIPAEPLRAARGAMSRDPRPTSMRWRRASRG